MRRSRKLPLVGVLIVNVLTTGCGRSNRETKLETELAELNQKIEATSAKQQAELQTAIKELAVAKSKAADLEDALVQARLQIENFTKEKTLQAEPKEHVINGDVFIVTKGGESFRLGLVAVSLLEEDVLAKHLYSRRSEGAVLAANLGEKLRQQEELLARKEEESRTLEVKSKAAFDKALNSPTDRLFELSRSAQSAYDASSDAVTKLEIGVYDLKFQVERLKSARFYYEGLPHALKMTKTNAEGQFSITLDAESSQLKTWIVASASRTVGKSQENYFWILPLRRSPGSFSTVVSLNNDNMTNTESEIFMHLKK